MHRRAIMPVTTVNLGNYTNLDIHTATNLYLYGAVDTPADYEDRLRSAEEYAALPIDRDGNSFLTVKIEMDNFMTNGPGRYAHASEASFVQDFFAGTTSINLPDGRYTKENLIDNYGYSGFNSERLFGSGYFLYSQWFYYCLCLSTAVFYIRGCKA